MKCIFVGEIQRRFISRGGSGIDDRGQGSLFEDVFLKMSAKYPHLILES
jgi:hypothetical protein